MSTEKRNKKDNGTGSIRQRKDGSWEARICIEGENKSIYGKTQPEVKRKLKEYIRLKAKGYNNVKKITLNEYLYNWLITYKLGVVKQSTYDRMEGTYIHHVKNTLGKKQMGSIDAKDIQLLLNEKVNPSNKDLRPLSYSSVKKIYELLNPCFEYAVQVGDLNINPMKYVKMPHKDNFIVKTKELFALSDAEMKTLKNVADMKRKNGEPFYRYAYIFMIMLNTGVRVGEMIALTWDDIDLNKRTMDINKSVMSNIKNRDLKASKKRIQITASTKTQNGNRIIYLNDSAIFYLNQMKEYIRNHHIDTNFVSCADNGNETTARNLQRTFDLVLTKANIEHCGLHILRHSFGSSLIRKGIDISVISKLMGHSSPAITRAKYIHVLKEQQIEAIKLLDVI